MVIRALLKTTPAAMQKVAWRRRELGRETSHEAVTIFLSKGKDHCEPRLLQRDYWK